MKFKDLLILFSNYREARCKNLKNILTKLSLTCRKPERFIPVRSVEPVSVGLEVTTGLQAILDNIDALVYVADFKTHDLLYMNAYGRKAWGDFQPGQKCWKVLQSADGPCSFCNNHLLIDSHGKPSGTHIWEFQNKVDKRWYQCRDQAITWSNGEFVRLEIAIDITERKRMELALQKAHQKAKAMSLQDDLTRLNNRRAFFSAWRPIPQTGPTAPDAHGSYHARSGPFQTNQ
ncbi:MAG: hypothetical protein WCY88_01050 [Spongiibacteraceae bacterium]